VTPRVALVGDRSDAVVAHRAIPLALRAASHRLGTALEGEWIDTSALARGAPERLGELAAVWCTPGSPYASTEGALAAIRFAREAGRPFLGTCGGFQHALLEHARAAWGIERPSHAETEPAADDPVIAPLACSLVGETGEIVLAPGSRVARAYGAERATEAYHCRYGLSPRFAARLDAGPLRVAARDANGEVRAVERAEHPFFVATLFQPERAALAGREHPLIAAFVAAAVAASR
jgi:CTP synthase (UTP-ammonia lyase)